MCTLVSAIMKIIMKHLQYRGKIMAFFYKMWLPVWTLVYSGQLNTCLLSLIMKAWMLQMYLAIVFMWAAFQLLTANILIAIPPIWHHPPSWVAFGLISPPYSFPPCCLPLSSPWPSSGHVCYSSSPTPHPLEPFDLQDLSFLIRDRTWAPSNESRVLTTGPPGNFCLFNLLFPKQTPCTTPLSPHC